MSEESLAERNGRGREASFSSHEAERIIDRDSLGRTIEAYGKYRPLDADEEIELAQKIEQGDLVAKDQFIIHNLRLVISFAKHHPRRDRVGLDQVVSDGIPGLIRAVEKFDWRKGYKFSTYAGSWINQSIEREGDKHDRLVKRTVPDEEFGRKVARHERDLLAVLGRDPDPEELANSVGCTPEEVERELQDRETKVHTSFDLPIGEDETPRWMLFPVDQPEVPEEVIAEETYRLLAEALPKLSELQRAVVTTILECEGHRQMAARKLRIKPELLKAAEKRAMTNLNNLLTGEDQAEYSEFWDNNHPPVTTKELREAVGTLRRKRPDLKLVEVGDRFGISGDQAKKYASEYEKNIG